MTEKLLATLEAFSIRLHELEAEGEDLPRWLADEVWLEINDRILYHYDHSWRDRAHLK